MDKMDLRFGTLYRRYDDKAFVKVQLYFKLASALQNWNKLNRVSWEVVKSVMSKTTFEFFILTFYWTKVSPNTITSRQRWMQLKCFRKQILCAKKSLYSATRKKSQRNINNSGRVLIRSCKGLETLLKRRNSNLLYATTEEQSLSMSGNPYISSCTAVIFKTKTCKGPQLLSKPTR